MAGDEFQHYYIDGVGRKFIPNDSGFFVEASNEVLARGEARRMEVNERRVSRGVKRKASWGATSNPISGSKRGIVILANFADKKMVIPTSTFNNYFNQEGFSGSGMNGSVHDYFYESSYGQFDLQFDVVGPVTVSKNMSYYGANDSYGNDKYAGAFICEAVRLADELGVDFSKYDWDNDGFVDQVYVIYAGYGEAQGASSSTIWPHEYELSSAKYSGDGEGAIKLDGVWIDTYATSCELRGTSGSNIDGIGTACHEFSHCMKIPDFYDTSGGTAFGMDIWDVMDYGCYNGKNSDGDSPWLYTSYERMYCGWLTPTELSSGREIKNMQPLETTPEAYIIYNEGNRDEYYLLENRQLMGFDAYGYGHGMLVLHVDFDSKAWVDGTVNNTASHQRMTIIPADNSLKSVANGISFVAGDPFPGTKGKTQLTDTSTPSAKLFNTNTNGRKLMGKPITNIRENQDGSISFTFDGGERLDAPSVIIDSIDVDRFTVSWDEVEGATSYELSLVEDDGQGNQSADALLLYEDFAGFNNDGSSDGTYDISSNLDAYTSASGWAGSKVFTSSSNSAKLGTKTAAGHLATPALEAQADSVTISVSLRAYGTDASKVNIYVGNSIVPSTILTLSSSMEPYVVSVPATEAMSIKFSGVGTNNRFYMTDLYVYDGVFSPDELTTLQNKSIRKSKLTTNYTTTSQDFTFSNLHSASTYHVSVRALNDRNVSPWSEAIEVHLPQPDGIMSTSATSTHVRTLYDLQGRRLRHTTKGINIADGKKFVGR